jgi:TctA family transporter
MTMKSCCIFLLSSFFASSEAFVLSSASLNPKTQLSAKTSSSRADFMRDVAATSIASVIASLPGVVNADDTEDLSMPTADEQKALDVSLTKQ